MDRTRRTPIVLVCTECKARNYKTTKRAESASATPLGGEGVDAAPPVELKKFCKQCKKHTVHKETK
jgi:large subunit ribosomal protein L33